MLFGELLQYNSVLKIVNLANNQITDACAPAFAEAIHTNHTLCELYLEDNALTVKGEALFEESFRTAYASSIVAITPRNVFKAKWGFSALTLARKKLIRN